MIDQKRISVKFIALFYIILLGIGLISVKDYGVSSDEYNARLKGFITLNYLGEKFIPEINESYKADKNIPTFEEVDRIKYYGPVFDASVAFFEVVFGIEDKKNQFLFKHYFCFILFFISLIFFFKIVNNRFDNKILALLGVLIIFLSPRIFANSFYNGKDIVFMSFIIFAMYFGLNFFKKPSFKNCLKFSLFAALAIDIRVLGVIIPPLILGIIFLKIFFTKENIKAYLLNSFLVLPFLFIFITLFWPFLWESPFNNFIEAFKGMSNYEVAKSLKIFYRGEIISSGAVPWNYIPVWILITTPILYIIFFLVGLLSLLINMFLFNKIKTTDTFYQDLFFLLLIFGSISSVIILGSPLFNGWRHFYFIYPSFVMITLYGFNYTYNIIKKNIFQKFYLFIIFASFFNIGFWMFVNHPHQYVFFNNFVNKGVEKNYEMDYWGLSYKENFEYLLSIDSKSKIKVWNASANTIFYHLLSIKTEDRNRIEIVESKEEADYIITNFYIDTNNYDKNFLNSHTIVNQILIDGKSINTLYKKK